MNADNHKSILIVPTSDNCKRGSDLETSLTDNIILRLQVEREPQVALSQTNSMRSLLQEILYELKEQEKEIEESINSCAKFFANYDDELPSHVLVPYHLQHDVDGDEDSSILPDRPASPNNYSEETHMEDVISIDCTIQNEINRLEQELALLRQRIQEQQRD